MKTAERRDLERKAEAALELRRRERAQKNSRKTVIGFVCPLKGFTHAIQQQANGEWCESLLHPDVYMAAKLERAVTSKKRFVVIVGGRGSTKSVGVAGICLIDAKDNGVKTYCLREFQSSIKNSVQSLLADETERLELDGFEAQGTSMLYNGKAMFEFAGLARNVDSIKSAHGFGRYWIEEAQFISEDSLNALTPTARNKPNKGLPRSVQEVETVDELESVSMVFVANPGSRADPFSQRFIVPFEDALLRDGHYEDDLHCVVKIDYCDNPWFAESGLEEERQFDQKHMSSAKYAWVWDGDYNDEVENSIISVEWFNAAVDAHLKLGWGDFKGAKFASFDPSDRGDDAKGFSIRHGNVFTDVREIIQPDAYRACDEATDAARECDYFNWDADGMGALLRRDVGVQLAETRTQYTEFHGSGAVDDPDRVYDSKATGGKPKKNKELFKNRRSQYYIRLANLFYNTYRAVEGGEYVDPDEMISISSEIPCLDQLRAEVCRIPLQENNRGYLQIMSKKDMKLIHKIDSPNMADCLMMSYANRVTRQGGRKEVRIPGITRRNMSRRGRHA